MSFPTSSPTSCPSRSPISSLRPGSTSHPTEPSQSHDPCHQPSLRHRSGNRLGGSDCIENRSLQLPVETEAASPSSLVHESQERAQPDTYCSSQQHPSVSHSNSPNRTVMHIQPPSSSLPIIPSFSLSQASEKLRSRLSSSEDLHVPACDPASSSLTHLTYRKHTGVDYDRMVSFYDEPPSSEGHGYNRLPLVLFNDEIIGVVPFEGKITDPFRKLGTFREDIQKVEVVALSSFGEKEEQFKEQRVFIVDVERALVVDVERALVVDVEKALDKYEMSSCCKSKAKVFFFISIDPGGLAGDRRGIIPASGFSFTAQQIWRDIKENKNFDLPSCKFDNKLMLDCYDTKAEYFDDSVRTVKRSQLESKLLQFFQPAYRSMLGHLRAKTSEDFKAKFEKALESGEGFAATTNDCTQYLHSMKAANVSS
ncbi:hypothetical protein M5K25_022497 [Dendrobium thyrsiflorum]|uniref:Sey1/RHD3-like three-helix bundle domain-containing protein n=1 Tax=Dendrobium thyrsiflorum TaxID=117978 RepID=A0ABD0UCE7_DENTH